MSMLAAVQKRPEEKKYKGKRTREDANKSPMRPFKVLQKLIAGEEVPLRLDVRRRRQGVGGLADLPGSDHRKRHENRKQEDSDDTFLGHMDWKERNPAVGW